MRFLKGISVLTILAMLFAVFPATVAEDEIVIDEKPVDEELSIDVEEDLEGFKAFGGLDLSLENTDLVLDGLEDNLLISGTGEQTEAPAVSNNNGDFVIDENGVLTRYRGYAKDVVIPVGVREIGDDAFKDDTLMENVTIPDSVTYIDSGAFYGCTGLKHMIIPDSVTDMGSYVFYDCTSLTSVQLSNKLTRISYRLFYGCSNLEMISLPASIREIKASAFQGCDSVKNLTLPDSVNSIEEFAFCDCDSLESITIPSSVMVIDRDAFTGSDNVIIRGTPGSYAERYANAMGIPFNAPVVTINEETERIYDDEDYQAIILYINQSLLLTAFQKPTDLARTLSWSSSDNNIATVDQNGTVYAVSQGIVTITVNTADGKGKEAQIKVLVPEPTSIEIDDDWDREDYDIILGETETIRAYRETPYQYTTGVEMPVTWSSSDSTIISIEATEEDKATLKALGLGMASITATTPDGGTASVELKVVRPEAEGVTIDQTGPIKLYIGQKYALSATVSPAEAKAKLTWGSWYTDVVTVSSKGVVTAVNEGDATVYVETDNGYDDSIEIKVLPTPTKITLNRKKATLGVKEQLKLKATFTPQDVMTPLTWTSSKPKVATVSKKGVVTPKAVGATVITVRTANGKTAKATITVKAAPKKVTLNKSGTVTLAKGKTLKLKATLPVNTASALTWKSSKPRVASVDQNGVVKALKKGSTDITVMTFNKKTATVTVTVK